MRTHVHMHESMHAPIMYAFLFSCVYVHTYCKKMCRHVHVCCKYLATYTCMCCFCVCACVHACTCQLVVDIYMCVAFVFVHERTYEKTQTHKYTRTQHTQQQQKVIVLHKRIMHDPRDGSCIFLISFHRKKVSYIFLEGGSRRYRIMCTDVHTRRLNASASFSSQKRRRYSTAPSVEVS